MLASYFVAMIKKNKETRITVHIVSALLKTFAVLTLTSFVFFRRRQPERHWVTKRKWRRCRQTWIWLTSAKSCVKLSTPSQTTPRPTVTLQWIVRARCMCVGLWGVGVGTLVTWQRACKIVCVFARARARVCVGEYGRRMGERRKSYTKKIKTWE